MRILIAEPHALLRAGIVGLIGTTLPEWKLRHVASLAEARQCLCNSDYTIFLAGSGLLDSNGLCELAGMRADFPALKVIVRSESVQRDAFLDCFRGGAHACISGAASAPELLHAINCVMSGEVAAPFALTDLVAPPTPESRPNRDIEPAKRLTCRQGEVLSLLGQGRSTKEIARSLDLAVGTIKVHLASIYRTLGARNRVEAAIRAAEWHCSPMQQPNIGNLQEKYYCTRLVIPRPLQRQKDIESR
jgi:DNA-binding NarL/FixJ family response regulator